MEGSSLHLISEKSCASNSVGQKEKVSRWLFRSEVPGSLRRPRGLRSKGQLLEFPRSSSQNPSFRGSAGPRERYVGQGRGPDLWHILLCRRAEDRSPTRGIRRGMGRGLL